EHLLEDQLADHQTRTQLDREWPLVGDLHRDSSPEARVDGWSGQVNTQSQSRETAPAFHPGSQTRLFGKLQALARQGQDEFARLDRYGSIAIQGHCFKEALRELGVEVRNRRVDRHRDATHLCRLPPGKLVTQTEIDGGC